MAARQDFTDKVVLITGSNSGIGEAIAIHFAGLGAKLIITGRDGARLEAVSEKCKAVSSNVDILSISADVTKDPELTQLMDKTIERFGKLDVLVNNAGIYQLCTVSDAQMLPLYEQIFDTNVRSVLALCQLAIPHLQRSKGAIVNVSSIASTKPGAVNVIYAMSKSSIDMLTKCLAIDLGPSGVRVNAINPAAIETPIFDKVLNSELSTEKMAELSGQQYPLRRIGQPRDCALAVAYLASADASFVTGVTLPVDGGSQFTEIILPQMK